MGQLTEVAPHLTTGSTSSIVEVMAQAPVLNFDAPDFSANLNTRALEECPGQQSALVEPCADHPGRGLGLERLWTSRVFAVSARILNNVLIDGADDNQAYYAEERGRTREAYSTPPEAIREFQVNTGVYPAEFGRAAGGVINSVTKSGGNQLHGQAYFYDRESAWGAFNDYTTNTVGTQNSAGAYTFTTSPYKPSDSRRIWGFTAGGALIKDKLFWQYTYDQHHRNLPGHGQGRKPRSPSSPCRMRLFADRFRPATWRQAMMTGASTLDSQVCTLAAREGLSSYAAGATAYSNGLASSACRSRIGSPRTGDQEVNMPKLDYQVNSQNHVSLLYNRLRWDSPGGVQTQATNTYAVDTFGTGLRQAGLRRGKADHADLSRVSATSCCTSTAAS